jgi:hypothetical protein
MKSFLAFIFLCTITFSCKKSNISDHEDYIGVWNNSNGSTTRKLEVKSNGKSFYEEETISGNSTKKKSYKGRFILENTTLKIGLKKFTINQEPALKNGTWFFTMDDIEYTGR